MSPFASKEPYKGNMPHSNRRILTIPNALTLLRLLLLPVFMYIILVLGNDLAAFLVLGAAAVTDFFDGLVARKTGQISSFGQVFDPIVDRLLILSCAVSLLLLNRIDLWVLLVFVLRDGIMLAISGVTVLGKRREFKVNVLGKIATALLMVAFASLILLWPTVPLNFAVWQNNNFVLGYVALYLGLFFYIIATLKYFVDLLKTLKSQNRLSTR